MYSATVHCPIIWSLKSVFPDERPDMRGLIGVGRVNHDITHDHCACAVWAHTSLIMWITFSQTYRTLYRTLTRAHAAYRGRREKEI